MGLLHGALTQLGDCEALHALPDLQVPLGRGIKQAAKTKPKAQGEGRGRKVRTVAMHRLAFTEPEQQFFLMIQVQQLYLGWLFCGTAECKPVNSISRPVRKNTKTKQNKQNTRHAFCQHPAKDL